MYPQSQQLVGYIDSQLSYGVAAAYIRQALLQAGWPLVIVDSSLNQELAHTAHILPAPLDLNAYYSSVAPQYYMAQPSMIAATQLADSVQPAPDSPQRDWIIIRAVFRFVATSGMAIAYIAGPVVLALGGLIVIGLIGGSPGINATAPLLIVWALAWTLICTARLAPAPVIAVLRPDLPLRDVLDYSFSLAGRKDRKG